MTLWIYFRLKAKHSNLIASISSTLLIATVSFDRIISTCCFFLMDRIQILGMCFAEFRLDVDQNDMTLGSKESWCTYNSMYLCVCVCVFPCIHKLYFSVRECVWRHMSLCVRESLVWTAGVQVFPSSSALTKSISGIIMLCRVCPTVCASVCSASCTWHTHAHTHTCTHTHTPVSTLNLDEVKGRLANEQMASLSVRLCNRIWFSLIPIDGFRRTPDNLPQCFRGRYSQQQQQSCHQPPFILCLSIKSLVTKAKNWVMAALLLSSSSSFL